MSKKGFLWSAIIILVLIIAAVLWLNKDIEQKQNEGVGGVLSKNFVEMSDDNPTFDHWGQNFPDYLDMYLTVEKEQPVATEFGGNLSYSKLTRYPQLTVLWAGYPFSVDFNEERGHFWVQVDQMDTARNNKDFLNSHGLAGFGGQPTACMNCHSGWTPWLLKNVAKDDWIAFNSTKYWTMIKNVPAVNGITPNSPEHSGPHGGKRMGVTCADCHNPNDMSLRLTRPAAINALVARGYEKDPIQGVKATREEMRTLVCSQCHVEYYFKPTGTKVKVMGESITNDSSKKWWNGTQKTYDEVDSWRDGNAPTQIEVDGLELVFPWSEWKKGQPFRIEMFDEYYEKVRSVFDKDWSHKYTEAPMLKIQHPESELYSGGVHAANGVSCADCHMPYVRKGAKKMTQHNITSPLQDINAACKTCHTQSEDYLKKQIKDIQNSVAYDLRKAEYALVSLINDTKILREELAKLDAYKQDTKAKISKELNEVLELQRKAQMRADFVGAENSTGFHNPREASRMLLQAIDMARIAQTKLVEIALANGIKDFKTSNLGFEDMQKLNPGELHYKVDLNGNKAGDRYYKHDNVNGNTPKELLEHDKNLVPYNYQIIDQK
ncbi:ammonia-forming cytochrome c nitrite reductase subunit c552 [Campylobacter sp. CCS1377]|uniref:nitrite reductase (cytochrome; ammonia-forming) n=1 Tax=Campylobacter sp. CCS1377 TaxID=3158229 RepID=A0AAU7E7E2_9BACT|nr:ammonia-forming cytochrome c nitrite reductase subunit c552 [Campylobacter jejuni]